MKFSTPTKQRAAWRRWAQENPDKAQANRNAWAKSPKGRLWLRANQARRNQKRKEWRKRRRNAFSGL